MLNNHPASIKRLYLVLLGTLLAYSACFDCQPVRALSDSSLGQCILTKVLLKDRDGHELIVFTGTTDAEIQSLVKSKPPLLWSDIKMLYGISSDTAVIRALSERNSAPFLFRAKPKKTTLVNVSGENKPPAVLKAIKQPLHAAIVDFLIVLIDTTGNKCLVYYHIINEGFSLALLERKNSSWEITAFRVETLE